MDEPKGYANTPGFVKSNPANNVSYLEQCKSVYSNWYDVIIVTDALIRNIVPNYNIAQIKEKFNALRYYIDLPLDTSASNAATVYLILGMAEYLCDDYNTKPKLPMYWQDVLNELGE